MGRFSTHNVRWRVPIGRRESGGRECGGDVAVVLKCVRWVGKVGWVEREGVCGVRARKWVGRGRGEGPGGIVLDVSGGKWLV